MYMYIKYNNTIESKLIHSNLCNNQNIYTYCILSILSYYAKIISFFSLSIDYGYIQGIGIKNRHQRIIIQNSTLKNQLQKKITKMALFSKSKASTVPY